MALRRRVRPGSARSATRGAVVVGRPLPGGAWPPESAARLRAPISGYPYHSSGVRAAMRAVERLGAPFFRRPAPRPVDWSGVRRVAILRLDHLGDLALLPPFLRRLRRAAPSARLDLWVGPWGEPMGRLLADVDAVRVTSAPWFARPRRSVLPLGAVAGLARALRAEGYDAAFDPRGDPRHLLALWGAGIPLRAALAEGGLGFLATHLAVCGAGAHEQDHSLALADRVGLPPVPGDRGDYLALPPEAEAEALSLERALRLRGKVVLVQAACGAGARRWPPEAWGAFLDGLGGAATVCLLGSEEERVEMGSLAARLRRPPRLAAGLGLAALAAFLRRADLLVSVDTGPAHLAALQGVPVLSLFSGATDPGRWAPRGGSVTVLRGPAPACSPCERTECPYGNACMAALDPRAVLGHALRLLERA